ncbi:MAG: FAD-dependent oxidoreductase [Candidatus Binatia bacterium]
MGTPPVVVLGGGLAGASTAYALARAGFDDVTIVERGPRLGGLAGSFERDGRFYPLGYHHILHRDRTLLFFLDLIGALPDVRWRKIRMLFRVADRLFDLGTARDFLAFPMSFRDKLRFARLMAYAYGKREWRDWEGRTGAQLIDTWAGPGVREAIFEPLCRLKFELPSSEVSAAWLGARLYFREGSAPLGYIPGANWTTTLCDGVTRLVTDAGVRIRTSTDVVALHTKADRVSAVEIGGGERLDGAIVVSALPTETYLQLLPSDTTPHLAAIKFTALISVVCATRQTVQPDFYWMNVAERGHTACGIFLLTSLNPTIGTPGETCVNFVTHLHDRERPLFRVSDDELLQRYHDDFRRIFGTPLESCWSKITRVPMYSPVLGPTFQNPPIASTTWRNVYFAGNYRTFPSVVSTGTALASGLAAAQTIAEAHGRHTDLPDAVRRFTKPPMTRVR